MEPKLDIHLNLGEIPVSGRTKNKIYISAPDLADYIHKYNLSHAVVLFVDINDYRELRKLVREEVKLYPLKWILEPKTFTLEEECLGICVHSHRGTLDGIKYGLNYESLSRYFRKLPTNSIICVHTQGSSGYKNVSRGLTVAAWALSHPTLKFLIEHAGNYFLNSYYPTTFSETIPFYEEIQKPELASVFQRAIGSENCVQDAVLTASKLANVFLDTSRIHTKTHKSDLLNTSLKWAYGSDFPFDHDQFSVDVQARIMSRHYRYTEECHKIIHQRGIEWLDSTAEFLWNNMIK